MLIRKVSAPMLTAPSSGKEAQIEERTPRREFASFSGIG